jgi:hypothetical protein
MPKNSKEIETFEFVENKFNQETILFEKFIDKVKNELNVNIRNNQNDELSDLTHSLLVYNSILENPISHSDEQIKILVIFLNKQNELKEYVNHIKISSSIKSILSIVAKSFGKNNTSKYNFKIHGKEEYLPLNANFSNLKYIRDCLSLNINPIFHLVKIETLKPRSIFKELSSKLSWHAKSYFSFQLDRNDYSFIKQPQLEEILNAIMENNEKIKKAVKDQNKVLLLSICETYRKNFNELSSNVLNVKYGKFKDSLELMIAKEKLINDNQGVSLDKKDLSTLLKAVKGLMESSIKFFNCASTSFYWGFKIKEIQSEKRKPQNLTTSKEKISVTIESLTNLSDLMSKIEFK